MHLTSSSAGYNIAPDDPHGSVGTRQERPITALWEGKKTGELIEKQPEILDNNERQKVMHELQRYAVTARNYDYITETPGVSVGSV